MNTHETQHMPVLLPQVLQVLGPKPGESYLDFTAGYGGHARAVLQQTKAPDKAILVDRDTQALASLQDLQDLGATPMHSDFASAAAQLHAEGKQFDLILADLGVSSPHVDVAERGFSFRHNGPLDMRMDQTQGKTAADVVNTSHEEDLYTIIKRYGEERRARKIAQAIVDARPITTTQELADIIEQHITRRGKIHPATRTFQALRMAVNDELEQVEQMLTHVESLLSPGGRIAIISFHSLEDRIVKTFFNERARSGYESTFELITRRPILGTIEADKYPRSRSAKLRAAVKK